jgi:hypothetical protein
MNIDFQPNTCPEAYLQQELAELRMELDCTKNRVSDEVLVLKAEKEALEKKLAEQRGRDELQNRMCKLEEALKFYAGELRADGNGYEFQYEDFIGDTARKALALYHHK